jgi:hypothetical protein
VGRHFFDDYNEHHRLIPAQLAEAKMMVDKFHAQEQAKPLQ